MGGTTFSCTASGADVAEAYQNAVDQAQYDYGHAGYTGTIAECDGYVLIQPTPMSMEAAVGLGEQLIRDGDPRIDDKWGPAGAIPLGDGRWYFFGWASC
jgi:hypothetical protein